MNGIERRIAKLEVKECPSIAAEEAQRAFARLMTDEGTQEDLDVFRRHPAMVRHLTLKQVEYFQEALLETIAAAPDTPAAERREARDELAKLRADRAAHAAWLENAMKGRFDRVAQP